MEMVHKPNGWALFPLGVFFSLYALTFIFTGNLDKIPIAVAFLLTGLAAILFSKGKLNTRISVFCKGAANETILLMVVIFILAGAFAGSANAMGAVDATVNAALYLLPHSMIPASIFIAACFISMSMGTSCGTIAALTPIAVGISSQIGISIPAMVGIVVGGAMFGDNLSYISDTTIVATRTQEVRMKDKFIVNLRIVLPVALVVMLIYIWQGIGLTGTIVTEEIAWIKILPYLVVLVAALAGANVILVLTVGIFLSGFIGLFDGFSVWNWMAAAEKGILGMSELIIVSLMAGGMFEVIRFNGGIDWLISKFTRNIRSKRKAEGSIAALISFTDLCTANNTIALIIVGPIARKISDTFHINRRRTASLLDTFSCFTQGLLPYGAQLLIASGIAQIRPVSVVPYLYYPFLIGIAAVATIIFQYPKKYTNESWELGIKN
ncbi:MAG: Na+/H+ antiporter NhaC family protein [Bacteroidales bacterium]|jgi:Na+/H+ antiporter NhaC|nr:Na+/H+ antiporter NhaC family protein [Bacteroidales bacterium]